MKATKLRHIFRTGLSALCLLFPVHNASAQAPAPNADATAKGDAAAKDTAPKSYKSFSDMVMKTMPGLSAAKAAASKPEMTADGKGVVAADALQYVDAVQAYYDKAKTYSAAFSQDYETVDGIKKESAGTVWFKKPGMMRWDYEKPESRFLISDGSSLWSWEPVYRQYCKQDLKTSQLPTALSFLTGQGKIEDEFSVKLGKVNGNQVSLDLVPLKPSMAYEHIKFEILMPSAKVYRATIYDAMGNLNRITFKNPEINAELDNSSFNFAPPADAQHICK
ncbi:MAG: outer membrane lipoprotein carrier protein LolA [Proteobacteria bacterium]|nr:outer membrane lipoprotein carrier protein LolA [Pseudomonadota bacterium]